MTNSYRWQTWLSPDVLSIQIGDQWTWKILIFCVWRLQDPIRSYKTPYSFKSFFCALIWYPVRYFVWWPCKVCCLVPHGTFLMKYGTFVRYLSYYVPLLTFWDLESAHFSAKFGRHKPIPTASPYSGGCTRSFQNKSGLLKPKIGWDMASCV